MEYIIERLRERSTWQGLVALLSAVGVAIHPALIEPIIALGVALGGLVHVLFPEGGALEPPSQE